MNCVSMESEVGIKTNGLDLLWAMSLHTFYSSAIKVHHRAKWLSTTAIFYFLCFTFNIFIPLFVVYNSDGLWRKVEFFREQPNINFKHNLIAILQLKNSPDIKFWSTFPHLNHLFGPHQLSVPYITVSLVVEQNLSVEIWQNWPVNSRSNYFVNFLRQPRTFPRWFHFFRPTNIIKGRNRIFMVKNSTKKITL